MGLGPPVCLDCKRYLDWRETGDKFKSGYWCSKCGADDDSPRTAHLWCCEPALQEEINRNTDFENLNEERRKAAKELHAHICRNGYPKWFNGVGNPEGSDQRRLTVFVKKKADCKLVPAEWNGFEVVVEAIGEIRLL